MASYCLIERLVLIYFSGAHHDQKLNGIVLEHSRLIPQNKALSNESDVTCDYSTWLIDIFKDIVNTGTQTH